MVPPTDDASELLSRLSLVPLDRFALMVELGWSGPRLAEACHAIREGHRVRLRTVDRKTIRCATRDDLDRARTIATRYLERHLLN